MEKKTNDFPLPKLTSISGMNGSPAKSKSNLLFGSKIVFNNLHYAEIESVNCKFFEILGIGGFQICDYRPIINEYSKVDPVQNLHSRLWMTRLT